MCAHFPSVVITIMDYKVQLINPLNLGELYAAYTVPKAVADFIVNNEM
jgi:hypothetical protein